MEAAREVFSEIPGLDFAASPMQALEDVDALIIITEWKVYRSPDFERMRRLMRQPVIIDGRNLFNPELVGHAGFDYLPIGRSASTCSPVLKLAIAA
jgi:UDPglucose 6-dehydrogenase